MDAKCNLCGSKSDDKCLSCHSPQQFYQALSDSVPGFIWKTKNDSRTLNPPWMQHRPLDVNSWIKEVHPDDQKRCLETLMDNVKSRTPFTMQYRLKKPVEEWRWILDSGKPHFNGGAFDGYIGSCVDITMQKRAEAEVQNARTADQIKSVFLANISHEMRTPLNGVIGNAALLANTPLTDLQRDLVESIHLCANRVLTIVNDVLDLSKIDSGMVDLEEREVDIRELCFNTAKVLKLEAEKRKNEIRVCIHPNVPQLVYADPTRLSQVIQNLLSNAVKFTENGQIKLHICLVSDNVGPECQTDRRKKFFYSPIVNSRSPPSKYSSGHSDSPSAEIDMSFGDEMTASKPSTVQHPYPNLELLVSVKDTGIGIAENRMPYLFRPFSQADSSTTRQYGGTGLGLSICRKLVRLMGGKIGCQSELGKGTEFLFTINLRAVPRSSELNTNRVMSRRELPRTPSAMLTDTESNFELYKPTRDVEATDKLPSFRRNYSSSMLRSRTLQGDTKGNKDFGEHNQARNQEFQSTFIPLQQASIFPLRILMAEDNLINQKVQGRILEHMGYKPDIVPDGAICLEALKNKSYDLVLMDVHMPVMDGVCATKQILSIYGAKRPKIVGLTASATKLEKDSFLKAGMDDVLLKPIVIKDLLAMLQNVFSTLPPRPAPIHIPSLSETASEATATPLMKDGHEENLKDSSLCELLRPLS